MYHICHCNARPVLPHPSTTPVDTHAIDWFRRHRGVELLPVSFLEIVLNLDLKYGITNLEGFRPWSIEPERIPVHSSLVKAPPASVISNGPLVSC